MQMASFSSAITLCNQYLLLNEKKTSKQADYFQFQIIL